MTRSATAIVCASVLVVHLGLVAWSVLRAHGHSTPPTALVTSPPLVAQLIRESPIKTAVQPVPQPAIQTQPRRVQTPTPQPVATRPQAVASTPVYAPVEAPVVTSSTEVAASAPRSSELVVSAPRQTSPSVDASFKGNRLPNYPTMSRRLGEQGTVMLRIQISAQGRAQAVELVKSSGHQRLDEAAIATVREWQFIPATRDAMPITAWYEWRWTFKLQ
jgi:protein TonB